MSEFAIQRLITNLITQLPGSTIGTLKLEIFNTVATFCREANTWQETQNFSTKIGKNVYQVTAASPDAYYNKLLNLEAYDPSDPNGEVTTPTQIAAWFDASTTGLQLKDTPSIVQRLRGTFSVVPRATDKMDEYPAIPQAFWDKYHDAIMEGVLSRMMSQPAKPYSNERLGIFHGRRFKSATSMAKNDLYNGDVRGGQNWSYPRGFTQRSSR